MRVASIHGVFGGLADMGGRGEVGFSQSEFQNADSLGLQFLRLGGGGNGGGGFDILDNSRDFHGSYFLKESACEECGEISISTPNTRTGFDVDCLLVDAGIQATQAVRDHRILEIVSFTPLAQMIRDRDDGGNRSCDRQWEATMTDRMETTFAQFTDEELSFFQENGYVIVKQLLDEPTRQLMMDRTLADLENLTEPIEYEAELQYPGAPASIQSEGGKTPRRLKTAHERDPIFLETLKLPKFLHRLQQLLGTTVIMPTVHHNCIMTKEPDYSSDTGWHQDIRYWRFAERDLVTIWLALGDEYPENGSLKVIPGSHRRTYSPEQFDEGLFFRTDLPENQELLSNVEHLSLAAGDVLFFHCRTFHAASRNYTDVPKYSAVFTFRGSENAPLPESRSASMPEILISEG